MSFSPEIVAIVAGLMVLANRIVTALVTPLFTKFNLDKSWLMYIAWIVAGIFVAFSNVNLFTGYFPNPIVGKIITAIIAGGGANILHDIADTPTLEVIELPEKE